MSDASLPERSCSSEFPNDNPALHDGAIWVCFSPCGPIRPVVRPRAGRSSTIPAPVPRVEVDVPAPVVAVETMPPAEAETVTEVTSLAPIHTEASEPCEPVEALPAAIRPEPIALEPEETPATEGCSLSAGLEPQEAVAAEPNKISELRELAAPASAEAEVVLECTPPPPAVEVVAASGDEAEDRRTILPPPSEDGESQTLTLARIHVTGRPSELAPHALESEAPAPSPSPEPEHAAPDPFAAFVAALVEVALFAGATRAAAVLPGFLDGAASDFSGFSDTARAYLRESGFVTDGDDRLSPSASFSLTSNAWRMVLRGESNDFSACGTSTLDGWAGDVLRAFGIGRDGKIDVKRELRRRGVAAFGMILAA